MQKISLLSLRQQFENANIQICFNGPLSHSIIEELGLAVRRYLESETTGSEKMMDVFSVYVEMTGGFKPEVQQRYDASVTAA